MTTTPSLVPGDDGPIELQLINLEEATLLHNMVLAKDHGLHGIRDQNALESALYAPERHLCYANPSATLPELAAVMAYELVKQHPFSDGNKRTAALLIPVFMRAHGITWRPKHKELVRNMVAIARSKSGDEARNGVIEVTAMWIRLSRAEYASRSWEYRIIS